MSGDRLHIEHILECVRRIEEYTSGGRDAFLRTTLIQDGVIRNLQTLAESSKRLSDGLRAAAPEIPWQQIVGFRNLVIQEYLRLDLSFVW